MGIFHYNLSWKNVSISSNPFCQIALGGTTIGFQLILKPSLSQFSLSNCEISAGMNLIRLCSRCNTLSFLKLQISLANTVSRLYEMINFFSLRNLAMAGGSFEIWFRCSLRRRKDGILHKTSGNLMSSLLLKSISRSFSQRASSRGR